MSDWISGAIKHPGAFTRKARKRGMTASEFGAQVRSNPERYDSTTVRQANLAKTLKSFKRSR